MADHAPIISYDRDFAKQAGGYKAGDYVRYMCRTYRSKRDGNLANPFDLDWWEAV